MAVFEKKDPGKFTVRFNMEDPHQKVVIDLLNRQGRYKAQFLTSAILHYVHCSETPDIWGVPAAGSAEIERIVRSILAQQQMAALQQGSQGQEDTAIPWEGLNSQPPKSSSSSEDADREVIFKTLNAFRTKQ